MLLEKECRICFENEETPDNKFIQPCLCKGTSQYVHRNCLQQWRQSNYNANASIKCRECNFEYKLKNIYDKENYIFNLKGLAFPLFSINFSLGILLTCIERYGTNFLLMGSINKELAKNMGKQNDVFDFMIYEELIYGINWLMLFFFFIFVAEYKIKNKEKYKEQTNIYILLPFSLIKTPFMIYLYILMAYLTEPTIGVFFILTNPLLMVNILSCHNDIIEGINEDTGCYDVLEIEDIDLEMDIINI